MKSLLDSGETFYYLDSLKKTLEVTNFEYKYRRLVSFLKAINETIQFVNLLIDNKERGGLNDKINTLLDGKKINIYNK